MTDFRIVLSHALAVLLAVSIPMTSIAAPEEGRKPAGAVATAPDFHAMVGSAAPPPADAAADVPLFSVMRESGSPGSLKYEATGITIDVVSMHGRLKFERARVALMPSADGRSCRFEFSGSPFGATTTFEATGSVEWAAGPSGGDKLDVVYRLGGAPVESVREFLPERIDPSFSGLLDAHGKASGVIGETTTEDLPATPLRGDVEAKLDWTVLGRTSPLVIVTQFSLDDRSVRLRDGRLSWEGIDLGLKGWFDPQPGGKFDLAATLSEIDTYKVAADWNVPEAWRPTSKLSGTITLKGKPGGGLIRYEASAPSIVVPGTGGYTIRVTEPKLQGSLVAINADVSASVRGTSVKIGEYELGALPVGVTWWRDKLTSSSSNTELWGGENDGSFSYIPAEHPKFTASGRIKSAKAPEMAAEVAPALGLDVDGSSSLAFTFGRDPDGTGYLTAHASLVTGRLGGVDVFARVMAELAAVDAALSLPDVAAVVPQPRSGAGTRVDRLFFEVDRTPDAFDIGGLYLRAGEFQLDGDGRFTHADGLLVEGVVTVPADVASRLVASAPWLASLRPDDAAPLTVPVIVSGKPASLSVSLAPGYAALLAQAKGGDKPGMPARRDVRHVGREGLPNIPGNPAAILE
ncbi:MAG: hypothetical protein ABR587_00670 [Candidatus Binatia bacterium]